MSAERHPIIAGNPKYDNVCGLTDGKRICMLPLGHHEPHHGDALEAQADQPAWSAFVTETIPAGSVVYVQDGEIHVDRFVDAE